MPKWKNRTLIRIALTMALALASAIALAGYASAEAQKLEPEWIVKGFDGAIVAAAGDGTIIVALGDRAIKLGKDGTVVWEAGIGSGASASAVEGDGSGGAWVGAGKTLIRLSGAGKRLWTYEYWDPILNLEALPDGRVLVGTEQGLILVDKGGEFVWLYDPASGCDT